MKHAIAWIASLGVTLPTLAGAQRAPEAPPQRAMSFEVGTGLQYDSNVAVLELDTSTNAGDASALFEFGVGYASRADGPLDVTAGYNLSQASHQDFDAFDLTIHRGSAGLAYDLGRTDVGVSVQHALAELDGEEFLTLTMVSPYVSRLAGTRLFLRFSYTHSDKDFAGNPQRNAQAASVSGDAYVFLNGLTTYLVFGYRYDDEDAVDAQFDYAGYRLNAQLARRFQLGAREVAFKTEMRFETRDYAGPTLSIGAPRRDDRYQLELSAEVPVAPRWLVRAAYRHADNRSNLPSVDFDEDVYSVGWRARF